jgi:hypothetical protein
MIASAFLWFFTIEKDTIRPDITWIIDNPKVGAACISHSIRLHSALKDE